MNILITGAIGFLGRNTAKKLNNKKNRIIGLGRGKTSSEFLKSWGIDKWYESEINFETLIKINIKFDLIIHCGGGSSVAFSNSNPIEDFDNSAKTTLSLLEYIRKSNVKCKFIYPSSPAVLGNFSNKDIKPVKDFKPISLYGLNKQVAEEICLHYNRNFGINIGIIRFFSIYGNDLKKQLLWDACNKIKSNSATFFGTGSETRDWIHVNDAVDLIQIFSQKFNGLKIINGGTGIATTNKTIIEMISSNFQRSIKIKFNNKVKEGDPQHYCANILESLSFGWVPKIKVESGVKNYVRNYIKLYD
jgi:UDP-glucose 4-epimerase